VVEDEAVVGAQPRAVEGLGPGERALLAGGEEQLHRCSRPLASQPAGHREHGRHRHLVVGPQDGLVAVAEKAALEHDLDRRGEGDGVHVAAEEDRPRAVLATGDAGEEVARVGARLGSAAVLLDFEAECAQLGRDRVGDSALAPRGALGLAQADEVVTQAPALLGARVLHARDGHDARV
jgi:hypothetical protein